jgi:hypothetical protein
MTRLHIPTWSSRLGRAGGWPVATALLLSAMAAPAAAQLSSTIPGVPTAAVPTLSRSWGQASLDMALRWESTDPRIRRAGDGRIGITRSYRIGQNLELGVGFTAADASLVLWEPDETEERPALWDGSVGYDVSLGAKYRVLSLVDLDGHGLEAAVFATFSPAHEPAVRVRQRGEGEWQTGGLLLGGEGEEEAGALPLVRVPAASSAGIVASYRGSRLLADVALEHSRESDMEEAPWVRRWPGTSLQAGLMVRVGRALHVGGSYWGEGAPPWGNAPVREGFEEVGDASVALVFGSGERRGAGTRLMVSTPTGDFGGSVRIMIVNFRAR